jgi:MraZ protein
MGSAEGEYPLCSVFAELEKGTMAIQTAKERTRFLGEYETVLSGQSILILPERFRAGLGEQAVLLCYPAQAITVMPVSLWENAKKELLGSGQSALPDHAFVTLDTKGRITLPRTICEWAALSPLAPVVIIGIGQKVEVWSMPVWEEYRASMFDTRDSFTPSGQ